MADFRRPEDLNRVESEAGIIATLIHHPEYSLNSEYLLPEHFTQRSNQLVYEAITGKAKEGAFQIDSYGILEWLRLHDADGANELSKETLDELIEMSDILCRNSIKEYKIIVSNVWDVAFRREMLMRLGDCRSILMNPDTENVREQIYGIVDSVMTSYSCGDDIEMFTEKIDSLWDEIQSRQGTGYSGIPFKFPALNDYVTIERGELIIFGAQQKVGKSIMLLNCAVDLLRQGYSVLYIDSELSDRLFAARILSFISGVAYRDLTSGRYTEEEKQRIYAARDWVKTQPFNHCYMPLMDAESLYTTVRRMNHIRPIDVLIVDYFKSSGNELDAFQTYAAMGKIVDLVKNGIAGDMNIAAIGAAQATANNKLADSAKIARNASTIIMLIDKTPDEIENDGKECGNKKMVVTVNRNGMQHSEGESISLVFDGNHISYEQAPKQPIPDIPY